MSRPVVAWLWGDPKRAKTSSLLAAFPRALWIGVPSAIQTVAEAEYGYTPAIWPETPRTLDDTWPILTAVEAHLHDYEAICLDDLTLVAQRSVNDWKDQAPIGRSGKPDGFWPYQKLAQACSQIADWARYRGLHVGFTSHERGPSFDDAGEQVLGGPDLASKSQTKRMPGWLDVSARVLPWPDSPDPYLPVRFDTMPFNPKWATGCRPGLPGTHTPPRLREILRESNTDYALPRLYGMDWMDEVAEEVCGRLADQDPVEAILAVSGPMQAWLAQDPRHPLWLRWAASDGIARYQLRVRKTRGLFDPTLLRERVAKDSTKPGAAPPPPPPPKAPA